MLNWMQQTKWFKYIGNICFGSATFFYVVGVFAASNFFCFLPKAIRFIRNLFTHTKDTKHASKCNRWSTALYFRQYNGHQSRSANHFRLKIISLFCCFFAFHFCFHSNSKCHARLSNFYPLTCDLCASRLIQTIRLNHVNHEAILNYVR